MSFLIDIPFAFAIQGAQDVQTFRAEVNVVNLSATARDKRDTLLAQLQREDFEVFEDGQKQTIRYFSAENDLPLTLGLLIDTSGSQERMFRIQRHVAVEFLRDIIREKDQAFLMTFDINVELVQDFTSSQRVLMLGLDRMRINRGDVGDDGKPIRYKRMTALYDAIYQASAEKLGQVAGRKALVILTDGQDQGSNVRLREAIESAQRADASCYVLLIAYGFYPGGLLPVGYNGDTAMKKLATETGGRFIVVGTDPEKLKQAFDQISSELRSQYSIGYTPTNAKRDGTYRKIEIRTKNGKVQARKGYYAAKR